MGHEDAPASGQAAGAGRSGRSDMDSVKALRAELADRLREMDPSDDYHDGASLDDRSYYAAIDRAVRLVKGEISDWQER